jgi:hypothetical protein
MRAVSMVVLSLVVLTACGGGGGGTDSGTPARPACDEIMERCHEFDRGVGEIHECHELSEDDSTTNEECVAEHDRCFAVCVPSDAGPAGDSGPPVDAGAVDADHEH